MHRIEKALANPEMEYRPRNYWGWLENITPEETRWQVRQMYQAGLGGYVMHARGGLTIPYAGEQWMNSVRAMIDEGRKYGMVTIVDDEHGWPSGFGAGKVNGKGEKYQLKYLKCEYVPEDAPERPHTLGAWPREGGRQLRVYAQVDKYYVDNMDPDVVDAFIQASYEDYNAQVGSEFGAGGVYGIFSDEPQTARYATPWSDVLPALYQKEYGQPLLPELYKVFEDCPGCEQLRCRLYGLMARCFTENYAGRLNRWCEGHGLKFMGHTCLEDDFAGQLRCALATMPFYEHMGVPGIDWLSRVPLNNMTILQLTSAAAQTGKKRVLSEMFGCAGWSVTPEELKWIAQWQHSLGINDQLQHLGLYSLRGSRKREYPASIFYQQPWFKKMVPYNDTFARISKLMAESTPQTDLMVLHPMHSAWAKYDGSEESLRPMTQEFVGLLDTLLGLGLMPHLGDETLMLRHGRVVGDALEIGACRYHSVLIPRLITMDAATCRLLAEFAAAGGRIYCIEALPAMLDGAPAQVELPCTLLANTREELGKAFRSPVRLEGGNGLTYVGRWNWRGSEFCYVVNNDLHRASDFSLRAEGHSFYEYDPMANALAREAVDGEKMHLEGGQARILFLGEQAEISKPAPAIYERRVVLDGKWKLENATDNALTLDHCRASFDGEHYGEEEYILDVQKRLLKAGENRDVWLKFRFVSEFETDAHLLVENPEKCRIAVNGAPVTCVDGWRVDKSLEAMPVHVRRGENEIVVMRRFENDERVYFVKNNDIHEAEANRVTVNTELESVYLWGKFAVKAEIVDSDGPRRSIETRRSFTLCPLPEEMEIEKLEQEGLLFFAGEVTLTRRITADTDCQARLSMARPCACVTEIGVNGETQALYWAPYECRARLKAGENQLQVTLTNSCRNLFGPHYRREGDSYSVGPFSYGKETENMHFVHLGIPGGLVVEY